MEDGPQDHKAKQPSICSKQQAAPRHETFLVEGPQSVLRCDTITELSPPRNERHGPSPIAIIAVRLSYRALPIL
jgi:hypothetical protein